MDELFVLYSTDNHETDELRDLLNVYGFDFYEPEPYGIDLPYLVLWRKPDEWIGIGGYEEAMKYIRNKYERQNGRNL